MGILAFVACLFPAELEHSCAQHLGVACLLPRLFFGSMYAAFATAAAAPSNQKAEAVGGEAGSLERIALTTLLSADGGSQTSPTSV